MSHSYDVIILLCKKITCDYQVFIRVSNGTKIIKIDHKNPRVIDENTVVPFLWNTVYTGKSQLNT